MLARLGLALTVLGVAASDAVGQDSTALSAEAYAAAMMASAEVSFPHADEAGRVRLVDCLVQATAPLSAREKGSLVQGRFVNMPDVAGPYPDVAQAAETCFAESTVIVLRYVILDATSGDFVSINANGAGSLPDHAGGVHYENGQLHVAGEPVVLPDFEHSLRVLISDDGVVTFEVDEAG